MKKKNMVIAGLLAALLAFSMALTGCPDTNINEGNKNPPYDPSEHPVDKKIESEDLSAEWGDINADILAAGQYVILDLSECAADGGTLEGSETPSGNALNVIKDNPYIKGIILPASLTTIGNYAFYGCKYLTIITISDGVSSIGNSVFKGCDSLTSITVAEDNTAYKSEDGVLFTAAQDELLQYPAGKSGAAYSIPEGVTDIGEDAFAACSKLTSITIPSSVAAIGQSAFAGSGSLTSITVNGGNTAYSSEDGVLFNAAKEELLQYPAGKSGAYSIPESVTDIGEDAFFKCAKLTEVTIPGTVSAIGEHAFDECASLIRIVFAPDSVIADGSFASDSFGGDLRDKYFSTGGAGTYTRSSGGTVWTKVLGIDPLNPETKVITGRNISTDWAAIVAQATTEGKYVILDLSACTATGNSIAGGLPPGNLNTNDINIIHNNPYIKGIILPSTLTTIGGAEDVVFAYCEYLTSVTIPASVTSISAFAFIGSNLTRITVNGGNTTYSSDENGVLFNANKTTLVTYPQGKTGAYTIPASVTAIGDRAFGTCTGLTEVIIHANVAAIGIEVFNTGGGIPSRLTSITVNGGNSNFSSEGGVLFNANKTTLVAYPAGKPAGSYAIPDSVTTIGWSAFGSCAALTGVTFGTSLQTIGENAFADSGLTSSIAIPNSVTTIENRAFQNCAGLEGVTFGTGALTIGNQAFQNCASLASITIPTNVTTIEDHAFEGCTALTSVTFAGATISDFRTDAPFDGDLRAKYQTVETGGAGTYTRTSGGTVWTKS